VSETETTCHPDVLRALRCELRQHRGGHLPAVQSDLAKLGTEAARVILHALRDGRTRANQMRSQPWRRF